MQIGGSFEMRRGVTLLELIVVITIITVLIGLLLPAVVQMRQSARNTECRNNLKQLGVALYSHEARLEHLPKDGQNGWGFGAFILPEVEQAALYQQIDPEQNVASPAYKPKIDTGLPVFLCPLFTRKGPKLADGSGRSCYMGNTELFSYGAQLEDIRDGASNTIMLAETNSEHAWALPGMATISGGPNKSPLGSDHPEGANFLLGDGSVKLITNSVDSNVFAALGTINGREPAGEF
jgi:prepilin-type N-terminal cleavage/methylation domain-containing protein/prepilin-type processing-associated H-X9-DG protein